MITILVFLVFLTVGTGRKGFGPGEQDWDYVTVRPGAYMFWWLYETTAKSIYGITDRPLIIWLQGGPGGSSTGFGNFVELGPLNLDLSPRNYTWVKEANILFIDNPVSTGFSYVDNAALITTTNKQIADDLVACLKGFYDKRPEFLSVPLYIAGESYGGKMAVEFALELEKKIKVATIKSNLQGIVLVDPWISPIDSVLTWAPYLYYTGAVDLHGYNEINAGAEKVAAAVNAKNFRLATTEWRYTQQIVNNVTSGIDWYNILRVIHLEKPGFLTEIEEKVSAIEGHIKEALALNESYNSNMDEVFNAQEGDFMKPVTHIVETLLNTTNIKIHILTGQLDLIVDTAGTIQWVDQLRWSNSNKWTKISRKSLIVNGIKEGYKKHVGQLTLYWINRSGHMVPMDNPAAMGAILDDLLSK